MANVDRTSPRVQDDLFRRAIRRLLAGEAPNGDDPASFGQWGETYVELSQAHRDGGTDAVIRALTALTNMNHGLAALLCEDPVASSTNDPPWSPRSDLPPELPRTPSLEAAMVPEALRGWLTDFADRACIPLEFVTIPALVALGSLVGRSLAIRPNGFDEFTVVPNLWGARSSVVRGP